ncbi:unnamed protein product [Linum trigynum]|uniref:Ubiquitin-like domain-containing protein n=1 Tax=Linum trigynum TaxID=586398 RepID=A0AAV2ETM9_9ROSI
MAYRRTDMVPGGESVITEDDAAAGSGGLHESCTNGARVRERAAATINYFRGSIEVTVRSAALFPGRELRISCLERDTVGELKQEIRSKWPVFVRDDITLYRSAADGGRPVKMEDDDAALSEYSVSDGAVIDAEYARADGWQRIRSMT